MAILSVAVSLARPVDGPIVYGAGMRAALTVT